MRDSSSSFRELFLSGSSARHRGRKRRFYEAAFLESVGETAPTGSRRSNEPELQSPNVGNDGSKRSRLGLLFLPVVVL